MTITDAPQAACDLTASAATKPAEQPAGAPPFTYGPPIENVCLACGAKHHGPFMNCIACRDAMNRGL